VRPAAELQVLARRATALSERDNMVEFEEPAFGAPTCRPGKRALAVIPLPHLTPDRRWHVTRTGRGRARRARAIGLRQLRPLQIRQEQRERAITDGRRVAVRD
jgi:hypothetical protein